MTKDRPIIVTAHKVVFDSPYLKVKQTKDKFFYAERKGVDSIAFMLVSKDEAEHRRFCVVKEFKDPMGQFVTTAFGGSIDEDEFKENLEHLVEIEVEEEAGFKVSKKDIKYVGKKLCSTQMNQFVHLFLIFVDKKKKGKKTTTNPTELKAQIAWVPAEILPKLTDWKAITIYSCAKDLGII